MIRTRITLILGALATIAIIAVSLTLHALLATSAESYLKTVADNTISLRGTRIPCMGYFDVGFIVFYRRPRVNVPFAAGRICRPIMSPDWVFYPDPNDATR